MYISVKIIIIILIRIIIINIKKEKEKLYINIRPKILNYSFFIIMDQLISSSSLSEFTIRSKFLHWKILGKYI